MTSENTLKALLKSKGIKSKDIATALGVSESAVSLKLSGSRTLSLEEATIIAKLAKVSLQQISCALDFAKCKAKETPTPAA